MKQKNQTDWLELAKSEYDRIEIPKELGGMVERLIQEHPRREKEIAEMRKRRMFVPKAAACAAAILFLFTLSLNTSTAFAQAMGELPVIGSIARIFTFRSYVEEEGNVQIHVEIPNVEMIAEDTGELADAVNQEIYTLCEQYSKEMMEYAQEYRNAFLETGGTEEEWASHNVKIDVGYEIKSQSDKYLSFAIRVDASWSSAYDKVVYYTMDLEHQSLVTLEDVLGEGYAEIADRSIQRQMAERAAHGASFFSEAEGGFVGVTQDSAFYMNQNGNPVVVFAKYEIAPGTYGEIEFEIMSQYEDQKAYVSGEEGLGEQFFEDNFSVPEQAVADFAARIKRVVEEQDLEGMADLIGYPIYMSTAEGAKNLDSREAFLELDSSAVFTPELIAAVAAAEVDDLKPSMAGFVLTKDGRPNIIFGVSEGRLQIKGINY